MITGVELLKSVHLNMRVSSVLLVDGAVQHFRPYVGAKIEAVFDIVVNSLMWKKRLCDNMI